MNTLPVQIRREFWEHRSLWIAPLVWVGIITVMSLWTIFVLIPNHGPQPMIMGLNAENMAQLSEEDRRQVEAAMAEAAKFPDERKQSVYAFSYLAITGLINVFVVIVVFFYLIDCLYAERRDRSILFWKSLPISDMQVVLSKIAVALVVVPLGALLLAAATQLLLFTMIWLKFHGTVIGAAMPDWSLVAWLKSQAVALGATMGGVMWYAPIAAYLLLVSSWARRNVFLWAVLPPVSLMALEGFFLRSANVANFLGQRFAGHFKAMDIDPNSFDTRTRDSSDELPRVDDVFDALDLSGMFTNAEVWLGLMAAAAMIYVTVRLRRFRDDS
jgi:ABC-2 type transport system permease protein